MSVTSPVPGTASRLLLGVNLALTTMVGAIYGLSIGKPLWMGALAGLGGGLLILLLQTQLLRRRSGRPAPTGRPAAPARARAPELRPALAPVAKGDMIALMLGNLLLLIVLATLLFGMWVAYAAAIIATPIWLIGLMAMALDGANPDHSVPLPDELDPAE